MMAWLAFFAAAAVAETLAVLTIVTVSRDGAEFRRRCDEVWKRIHGR